MMLKFFFWILVLGNAGLFTYQQGYFDAFVSSGHEPARMKDQLNADKIKLIPAPPPTPVAAPAPMPAAAPAAEHAAANEPVVAEATAAKAAPEKPAEEKKPEEKKPEEKKLPVIACTEVGNFGADDAARFTAQLTKASLGEGMKKRPIQEATSHIVFIPPQADKEGADKKAAELRSLGIEDFFIIQDNSSLRWGISLGVFKQEEAARTHLANLNQKGVRSARIAPRTVSSSMVAFQLHDLDAEKKKALDRIKADFPKQEIRRCAAR